MYLFSLRYAWRALRQIFIFIVIFIVLKSIYTHLPPTPAPLGMILSLVIILIAIFLFVMSLYRVDGMLRETPVSILQAGWRTLKSILKIYLACLLVFCGFVLIFVIGRWLIFSVLGLSPTAGGLIAMLIVGIPMILLLIYCYLTIPLLALYEPSIVRAFYRSLTCAQKQFLSVVILYMEIVIILVVSSTHTHHAQWLLHHHLMELCDLVIFSLILPVMINQTLLLLHNARISIPSPSQGEG